MHGMYLICKQRRSRLSRATLEAANCDKFWLLSSLKLSPAKDAAPGKKLMH